MEEIIGKTTAELIAVKQEEKLARELDRKRKREEKERMVQQKAQEKKAKLQERTQKRIEQEHEKIRKRALQEAHRNIKPGHCLKQMTVIIDPDVLKGTCGASILEKLKQQDTRYEIQPQVIPGIITFSREVVAVREDEPGKVEIDKKEVLEDLVLFYVPVAEFVSMVSVFNKERYGSNSGEGSLRGYVANAAELLQCRKVALLVQGLEKYFKEQGKSRKQMKTDISISRVDVEEALIDLQLHTECNVKFMEKDEEVSKTLHQFTKAVAEAPNKQMRLNTGLDMYVESSGSVKISKDGYGLTQAWRQQIQQFKNVSAEMANSIMAVYPTPLSLRRAYLACSSSTEAALLLQDIMVRRGVGVLATSRRIGKELSRKIHTLLTQEDPEFVIQ